MMEKPSKSKRFKVLDSELKPLSVHRSHLPLGLLLDLRSTACIDAFRPLMESEKVVKLPLGTCFSMIFTGFHWFSYVSSSVFICFSLFFIVFHRRPLGCGARTPTSRGSCTRRCRSA